MRRTLKQLWSRTEGAVAPTVALSLVGLIAAAGIAFDYARMATMQTELHNAADQAALAAATQLDGQSGAIQRAEAAAQSLIANKTLFANDGNGTNVGNLSFTFYASYDEAGDAFGPETSSDTAAKVVKVTVGGRTAMFALTPIVGALSSGAIGAEAVAGLSTAVCKVPPLMICNPNEAADPDFNLSYAGKGMLLVARQNTADAYGPGNFGFLDTSYDTNGGDKVLRQALGQTSFFQDCLGGDTVTTNPGASSPALDALNTRFDIYDTNIQQTDVCGNGQCPPSTNVRKDLMRDASSGGGSAGSVINSSCKPANEDTGQKGWKLIPAAARYLPTSNAALNAGQRNALAPMGHPRDICHAFNPATGCSGGRIGDGVWDRDAYFKSNFNWDHATWVSNVGLGSTPTRYQVYRWEISHNVDVTPAGYNKAYDVKDTVPPKNTLGTLTAKPMCEPSNAVAPVGDIDRRKLTVAVVNCSGSNSAAGRKSLTVKQWLDVFLVEPSWNRDRTTANDLYVEVIGKASITGADNQTYKVERSVPYLIR